MTSTPSNQIVLNYESEYDLILDLSGSYDLPLYPHITNDIKIEGLTLRSNLYGDELEPCIMYLETDSELTPYVIILNNSILNQDDLLLTDLDPYLLSDIYKTNLENIHFALITSCDIGTVNAFISPQRNDLKLTTQRTLSNFDGVPLSVLDGLLINDDIHLQLYINNLVNELGVECGQVELLAISYIMLSDKFGFRLNHNLRDNILLTLYLTSVQHPLTSFDTYYLTDLDDNYLSDMDDIDNTMKLSSTQIHLEIEKYLSSNNFNLPLRQIVNELYQDSEVKVDGNNILSLSNNNIDVNMEKYFADSNFELPVVTEEALLSINKTVNLSRHNLPLQSGLDYKEFLTAYDYNYLDELDDIELIRLDGADDCIYLNFTIDGTFASTLETSAELTLEPSPGFYDETLLVDLDPYNLENLEQEILS